MLVLEYLTPQHVFLIILSASVQTEAKCKDDAGCLYSNGNVTSADCSSRNLSYPPCFNETTGLVAINLRHNQLNSIPENLPKGVEYLDLSYNRIPGNLSYLQQYTKLKHLNLDYNQLNVNTHFLNIRRFDILNLMSNLVFLSLKGNFNLGTQHYYSNDLLAGFDSLFHLRIDGLSNGNFGDMFSRNVTDLKILDVSGRDGYCKMPRLTATMFAKFNLTHLYISYCGLLSIDMGTLKSQEYLHFLDASHNDRLGFGGLQNVSRDLQNTTIKVLKLNKVHCSFGLGTILLLHHTKYLKYTSLEELYLDSNRLELMETGVITYNIPKTLKLLSLADNRLENGVYLLETSSLHNLQTLNVSFQLFSHNNYFDFCYDYSESCYLYNQTEREILTKDLDVLKNHHFFHPHYHLLGLSSNPPNFTFYLPRNMQTLYANDMKLQFRVGEIRFDRQCDLKHVHFQNNYLYDIYGPFSGCRNVTYVDLSNNYCTTISRHAFSAVPLLEVLNISKNFLGPNLQRDVEGEIFRRNPFLTVVNLHDNKITELPRILFAKNFMIEELNVSNNKIEHWTADLSHMHKFRRLDLSYNLIKELDERSIDLLPQNDEFFIMLQGNPLSCTCKNQQFFNWINRYPSSRFPKLAQTSCTYRNGSDVLLVHLPEILEMLQKDCSSYSLIILLASSFICLTTSLVIYRIIYRYRWKILYIYYLTKRILLPETTSTKRKQFYESDAFISYADAERGFVVNMARRLENSGLKICIHDRDFVPGVDIAENITNAIHNSRRIVFVMTSDFLKSHWCMFELNMARMESIYSRGGDNIMLLVLLEKDVVKEMPRSLLDIVESKSYLEYPDDDSLHCPSVFWENLEDAIQDKE